MQKLQKARQNLRKNSKKGFTLVELIVVIVIIAILIAALTPAILGVIQRANATADQADIRSVMMAGSVAGLNLNPPATPEGSDVVTELTGAQNVKAGTYTLWFQGAVAVGGRLPAADSRSKEVQDVGDTSGTDTTSITVTVS